MFAITLKFDDATTDTVKVRPIDQSIWERDTDQKISQLADGVGMHDLLVMAHSAARRSSHPRHVDTDGKRLPFPIWADRIEDLDFDELPELDVSPTPPGASPG